MDERAVGRRIHAAAGDLAAAVRVAGGTAFQIFGVLGVVWAVVFYRWFRDNPRDTPSVNQAELALLEAADKMASGHGNVPWRKLVDLAPRSGCSGFSISASPTPGILHHLAADIPAGSAGT